MAIVEWEAVTRASRNGGTDDFLRRVNLGREGKFD